MHEDNMMPRRQRRAYEIHAKSNEYKQRIREAKQNIHEILSEKEFKPVIEYSGGKDSIVLVDLVMRQDNTVPVWNYHPGYAHSINQLFRSQNTQDEIIKTLHTMKNVPETVHVANIPADDENYLIRDYFEVLFEYMQLNELNLELLGIRGQESVTRKQRVKQDLVHLESNRVVSFPISNLTVDDVWAYIITNDIYYTSHYDKYGPIYGWDNVRFTSHFNENDLYTGGNYFFDRIMYHDEINEQPKHKR